MKSRYFVFTFLTLTTVLPFSKSFTAETYPPSVLYVLFQPGAIDSVWMDSAGVPVCGLSYIDSINQANDCIYFLCTGDSALHAKLNCYHIFFAGVESPDLPALSDAYLQDPHVRAASPDYFVTPLISPSDSLFPSHYGQSSQWCWQWAFDSAHCQFEKAWDITRGDTNVIVVINDVGIHWQQPDLRQKLWVNSPEDSNGNGTFEPWRSDTIINGLHGDLDRDDDDENGYKDDVIGGQFGDYTIYGRIVTDCPGSPPPTFDPANRAPILVCDANCKGYPPGCEVFIIPDSIRPVGLYPVVDTIGPEKPHGTWVASIAVAAANDTGMVGAAPNCRFLAITAAAGKISGNVAGIVYAQDMARLKHKKMVINMSWQADSLRDKSALEWLFEELTKDSIVMVVSAGNKDKDTALYPASDTNVISVSGLDTADARPSGVAGKAPTYNESVDLSAPWEHWVAHSTVPGVPDWIYSIYIAQNPLPGCVSPLYEFGTSLSAPFVAGAAALVKSVYPRFSNAEVRAKLRSSTDLIKWQPGNAVESTIVVNGKLGTGRLNAFKALTFFGNIPNAANDTTLHDTVYVSGDIRVKSGKTLRLDSACVLRFYPGDVMKAGVDTTKTEIVVESGGKLIIGKPSGPPARLVSFRKDPDSTTTNDWRGIRVENGGRISVKNAVIRHAYAGIDHASPHLDTIQNVQISKCQIYGIRTDAADSLVIRSCRVEYVNTGSGGYGIYVNGGSSNGAGTRLIRDTVSACYKGIVIDGGLMPVETCLVLGSTGAPWSHTGLKALNQGYFGDSLPIHSTSINGYFAAQHFENGYKGRAFLTKCNLITDEAQRSPYGVWNVCYQCSLNVRKTKVIDWSYKGVATAHNNSQKGTDLGTATSTDSGLNTITTSMPTWDEETEKPILWYYVTDNDCGSCVNPVIKAEANWWGGCPPTYNTRFSNNIDRSPCLSSAPPKIIAGEGGTTSLPKPTALFQNYPNPFNPTTLIQFNLEKTEKVNLDIFNILGQKVRTLLSGEEFASGPYTFLWDGKDSHGVSLSSGVYFYRLQTPTYMKTKKMMLVK